jgi:hypothetical protein
VCGTGRPVRKKGHKQGNYYMNLSAEPGKLFREERGKNNLDLVHFWLKRNTLYNFSRRRLGVNQRRIIRFIQN